MLSLKQQIQHSVRRLFSEQDANPYSPSFGCFDRRYWAWKIVDYSESTYQRNVYPLAWLSKSELRGDLPVAHIEERIRAGLLYATKIQHPDGSFDQAFPYEHSFGATAFLLPALLRAHLQVRPVLNKETSQHISACIQNAAEHLCHHDEQHALISNHLAGAAMALYETADIFGQQEYERRANFFLARVLAHQSQEGWFVEYEGADPGYQTLCMDYLAQIHRLRPDAKLTEALERSLRFLSWFIHPDGTFGGDYGSRRTALYYPGGIALLADEFPAARAIHRTMLAAIETGTTSTLMDVDMGNLAPLLTSYLLAAETDHSKEGWMEERLAVLPKDRSASADFYEAGLFVRSTPKYYIVFGASNGGVIKLFSKQRIVFDDGGYVAQTNDRRWVTTQTTQHRATTQIAETELMVKAGFYRFVQRTPSPAQFLVLRILNLTVMRFAIFGKIIKSWLVDLLITGKRREDISLQRRVLLGEDSVQIHDRIQAGLGIRFRRLFHGRPFSAIHMASAGYFQGPQAFAENELGESEELEATHVFHF